jgi:integration host factor subunit beta
VTKSELVTAISEANPGLGRRHVEMVVNTIFDSMRDALLGGDRIEIRGFGSFTVRVRRPRTGRNPKTGVSVDIGEKKVPFFKVGKELRERVNGGVDPGPDDS